MVIQETPTQGPAERVLILVREFCGELHADRRARAEVTLDSALDRDLGLDSLSRVELIARIERSFGRHLPEEALTEAETPRDLLRLLAGARVAAAHVPVPIETEPADAPARPAPDYTANLLEALDWHAGEHPDRTHVVLLQDGEQQPMTYGELRREAGELASGLIERGLLPGQTVALMLPTSRAYFQSFAGVLLAGGIPVPIYPPARLSQLEDHLRRHARILDNAGCRALVTVPQARSVARLLKSHVGSLRVVATPEELMADGAGAGPLATPPIPTGDTAFLQYTSGSTGDPKGVVLTHAGLLANLRAMGAAADAGPDDVFVSWLPLYHDMGLIGAWLGSLYYAYRLVVMSPLAFLSRPAEWLWAIHEHGGTLSAGRNFAYELCLGNVRDEDVEGLDLSSWRMAFNGAEPVSPDTLRRFQKRFARHGFRPEAMAPVYGLAEACLGVAFPPLGRGPRVDRVRRAPFQASGSAEPAPEGEAGCLRFVGCGEALPGYDVRVVDAEGGEVGERREGRLLFRGPSTTPGYFRNPEATRALLRGEWLDTGDRAYRVGDELFITSRVKDLIIRGGRNVHPHELEEAVGDLEGVRKGCVVAFGCSDPDTGTERLVMVVETRETDAGARADLLRRIEETAVGLVDLAPDEVVLSPPRTVLKTSSGKVRRAATRELYERGALAQTQRAVWMQVARLLGSGVGPQFRRAFRRAGEAAYAAYAWVVFLLGIPWLWLLVALTRDPARARRLMRRASRGLLAVLGVRLTVDGDPAAPGGPRVVVANHGSYLDAVVLAAVLPPDFAFVAKSELERGAAARVFLRRLGTAFVERFDRARSVQDSERLSEALQEGRSLVIFPEGTCTRGAALLPFHMGAFLAAAHADRPVVPVGIRGTRRVLYPGRWFPRRRPVHVTVGAPLHPGGAEWGAAVELRDRAREAVRAAWKGGPAAG